MNHTKLRKALGHALGLSVLTTLAALFTAPTAFANVDQQAQWFGQLAVSDLKIGGAPSYSGATASTATTSMELFYNGSATAAYVSINGSGCVTFYAPYNVIDTSIGSATCGQSGGTFDTTASTENTMGALCDLINGALVTTGTNGSANGGPPNATAYHCTLTGSVRSDSTTVGEWLPNITAASGVNALNAVGGYKVPVGTTTIMSMDIIPAPGRRVVLNYVTVNAAGTPNVTVYGAKAKLGIGAAPKSYFGVASTDSDLVWQSPALATNTTTNEPLATPVAFPWIEFSQGGAGYTYLTPPVGGSYNGHVVVRVNGYGGAQPADTSSNFILASWLEK